MDQRTSLISLAETLAKHRGVTHFAISMQALGKGDFFANLIKGGDCRTRTAARLFQFFSEVWPSDLEWPHSIQRPEKLKAASKEAA